MKNLIFSRVIVLGFMSLAFTACANKSSDVADAQSTSDASAPTTYQCSVSSNPDELGIPDETTIEVSAKLLGYTDEFGQTVGEIDASYHPANGAARYKGFEFGEDCELSVIVDAAIVAFEQSGEVKFVCKSDSTSTKTFNCEKE